MINRQLLNPASIVVVGGSDDYGVLHGNFPPYSSSLAGDRRGSLI